MSEPSSSIRTGYKNTILIVDDENIFRIMLKTILEPEGYNVITAANGEEGIAYAKKIKPGLILMDVNMPVMGGFDAARELRKIEHLSETPIVFLSAEQTPEMKSEGFELGADDYIVKPFDTKELVARIKLRLQKGQEAIKEKNEVRIETLSKIMVTLAHHLNNSVAVILAQSELVDTNNPNDVQKMCNDIQKQCKKIILIIRSLEEMARSNKLRTNDYLNIKDAMLDISQRLETELRKHGLR